MLALNPKKQHRKAYCPPCRYGQFFCICRGQRTELKGLPVVVGADPKGGKGRGVVSTCSYDARKYGIHSAMPISQAYKLCPDAAFVPVNMKLYVGVSANVMEI